MIVGFLERLTCKHPNPEWISNIYGDEINHTCGRSWWICPKCGSLFTRPNLKKEDEIV